MHDKSDILIIYWDTAPNGFPKDAQMKIWWD